MNAVPTPALPGADRRRFLALTTVLAVPASLPRLVSAAVKGNTNVATWAASTDPALFARAWAARFTNVLPNPLVPAFIYKPDPGTAATYTVSAGQFLANVLGVSDTVTSTKTVLVPVKKGYGTTYVPKQVKTTTVTPVLTKAWGYQNFETAAPTYPGRTFEVQRKSPVTVLWKNNLIDSAGKPLPHLLPVDQTIAIQAPTTGVPLAVHHHGGDNAAEFDGGPDQWSTPLRVQVGPGIGGANVDKKVKAIHDEYTNAQEASMHWYHDHAEGLTRINVGAGLAGLYVIRDSNEAMLQGLGYIPARQHEMALVIQDRCFTAKGDLAYTAKPADYPVPLGGNFPGGNPTHQPEMFGDVILVNGKAWPTASVEPRPYRVRVLNGSDSRFYTLQFGGAPMFQIGTDLGLLNKSVALSSLTIGPGERADLVVDFSAQKGKSLIVSNSAPIPFPGGVAPLAGSGTSQVMRFVVNGALGSAPRAQAKAGLPLRGYTSAAPVISATGLSLPSPGAGKLVHRQIILAEGVDQYGRITPMLGNFTPTKASTNLGTRSFQDPPTETPALGSTEVWSIHNVSVDAHPVHFHLVQFLVRHRQELQYTTQATVMPNGWEGVKLLSAVDIGKPKLAPAGSEQGWKDTVVCPPNQVTTVVMTFNRPGKYVYHCHILSHEEHDMMRWYQVI